MEREHSLRHNRLKILVANPAKGHRLTVYREWIKAIDTLHSIGLLNVSQHKRIEAKINASYEEAKSLVGGE